MATFTLYNLVTPSNLVAPSSSSTETTENLHLEGLARESSPLSIDQILVQVKRLERRTFPKSEAMNFDAELHKRNTELIVVLDCSPPTEAVNFAISEATRQPPKNLLSPNPQSAEAKAQDTSNTVAGLSSDQNDAALVVAYILHARSAGVSLLHKVCVAEKYRRQGIGMELLSKFKARLEGQGCERIQLWVDWQRVGAIKLYTSAGYRRIDGARDYYGVSRHGIKMAIDLNWVW